MNVANTTPTARDATTVRMIDATIAAVPLVMSHGTSGMKAPRANDRNDDTAACTGEPRCAGLMPSSSRGVRLEGQLGVLHDLVHHVAGDGGGDTALLVHAEELLRLAFGTLREGLSFHIELALEELALGRHGEVLPRPHGEGAGDQTRHPDQPDDLAPGTGARDAEHQRDVGDQAVAQPENGRSRPTAPDITMLVELELIGHFHKRSDPRCPGRDTL